jgi:hypothetical protein
MRRLGFAAALMVLAFPASAPAADKALQDELAALYRSYSAAVAADKVEEALTLRAGEVRKDIETELSTGSEEERKEMREMLRGTTPDSIEVQHLESAGETATLHVVGSKKMAFGPDAGKIKRIEMEIEFLKEGGTWLIGMPTFLGDPDQIKRIEDVAYEPIDSYDQDRSIDFGGRIVRVGEAADHTLLILRIVDEENAVFLPPRAELEAAGFDVDALQPFVVVEAAGYPHRSNAQKLWATTLSIVH